MKSKNILDINHMNTFNYLWCWYLNPSHIHLLNASKSDQNTDDKIFQFFMKLKTSTLTSTLSNYLLCSDKKPNLIENPVPLRNKYRVLKYVLQNPFLNESQKNDFLALFQFIQKQYFILSRFAHAWKWKRAVVSIDTDLFLSTIDIKKRNCFLLYQGKTKFYFIISDLMRLLEMAIWQNWEGTFRVKSQIPANPYTKTDFRVVDLYNIYYHMKFNMDIIMPLFFHLWFLDGFCFKTFLRNNDQYIRKMCIRQFAKTASNKNQLIYKHTIEMLADYYCSCKLKIHVDFPKDVLVDVMRPYLYLHYLITFDIVSFRQASFNEILLNRALKHFYEANKLFGRKEIKTTRCLKTSDFSLEFCKELSSKERKDEYFHIETIGFSSWHL